MMRFPRRPLAPSSPPNPAALPVTELVNGLRAAGLALIGAALGTPPPRPPSDWLPTGGPALLAAFRDPPQPPPDSFARLSNDVVHGRQTTAQWQSGLIAAARRAAGLNDGYALPSGGWEALGRWAWGGPAFQRDAVALLEAKLRANVLFVGGDWSTLRQPTLSLSPQTIWLLLALAAPHRIAPRPSWLRRLMAEARAALVALRARRWPWPRRRDDSELASAMFVELGRRHGLVPGWAGVWDQWLLLQAVRRWPGDDAGPVRAAIAALPLAGPPRPGGLSLARPHWSNECPAWFQTWWTRTAAGSAPAKEQP